MASTHDNLSAEPRTVALAPVPPSSHRPCPACEAPNASPKGVVSGFEVVACLRCGTLYAARLPTGDDAEDYDAYYTPSNLASPDFIAPRLDEIVRSIGAERRTGRWLDIGFGAGALMQAARRAGWEVTGIEVSRTACAHVASLGFDVVQGYLTSNSFPADSFDVVTAVEVLEHVPDPSRLLTDMRTVLRPGGVFWGTTPHGGGLSARLLGARWSVVSPPEHLQLFTVDGMHRVLQRTGFTSRRLATHGTNPFEIYHVLRGGPSVPATEGGFDRVKTSYALNAALSGRPAARIVKTGLNWVLDRTRTGDSLKVHAS